MTKWSVIIPKGCSGHCRRLGIKLCIGDFRDVLVIDVNTVRCDSDSRLVQDLSGLLYRSSDVLGVIAHIDTDTKRRVLLPMQPLVDV